MTQIQSTTVADRLEKLHWPAVLLLHLAPGAAAFGGMLAVEPLIVRLGWPRDFASTASFAAVLTPIELGLLLVAVHRSTGRWSPAALPAILSYRRRLGRWALLVPALFGVALLIAVGLTPVSNGIGSWMKGIYPAWLLPDFDGTAGHSTSLVVLTSMLTLLVDGTANPIVEELYFRAWLLPRLPVTGWRGWGYLLAGLPAALLAATVALGQAKLYDSGGVAHGVVGSVPAALPWALGGLFLLWVGGWLVQALAIGQARLAAILLAPTEASRLRHRVTDLTATRAAAVQVQQQELRRIERDLHDGAQARLVAMSVDLGLAGEAFDENPDQARQLLEQAREGLILALAEIRDLVRGIGPPVLRDRGLPAALEALAARNPIPVSVTIVLPHRPPATVETVAYFVVCEALTNATKHSRADQLLVRVQAEAATCLVTVTDDGVGGADQNGPGLRGLTDRVAAIDGSLNVESPSGGPTRLRAVLPCAW